MAEYVWTTEDGKFGVTREPELNHESVEFDVVFVPEPKGVFRATYRSDAKGPVFQNLGAVDKTREQGARAALKAFAKLRADAIKNLQAEGKRRRALRQK
jgi:hypothetical protein